MEISCTSLAAQKFKKKAFYTTTGKVNETQEGIFLETKKGELLAEKRSSERGKKQFPFLRGRGRAQPFQGGGGGRSNRFTQKIWRGALVTWQGGEGRDRQGGARGELREGKKVGEKVFVSVETRDKCHR